VLASLWSGSAASWVNLNPTGSTASEAWGGSGSNQVGYATLGGVQEAALWSGTAASFVSLHPGGASSSRGHESDGSQQVGYAVVGGASHASLWTGTAGSWVDLNPSGATSSTAWGVLGGYQVGGAVIGGAQRASLWNGSAGSFVDLHSFLPASFSNSVARSISTDGVNYYIVGGGLNTATGRGEAILWTQAVPEPVTALTLGVGLLGRPRKRRLSGKGAKS
jgi:hypothetical protein